METFLWVVVKRKGPHKKQITICKHEISHDHFVCLYLKTWRVSFYRSHRRFRLNFRILSIPVLYNFSRFCRKFLGEYFSPKVWRPYKLVLLISCLQIVICFLCGPFLFTTTLKNVSIYTRQPWFSLTTHFHQNGITEIVLKVALNTITLTLHLS
jgi:hypothetical protein